MKKLLLLSMCLASVCLCSQAEETDVFKKFGRRIAPREVKTIEQIKEEKTRTPVELAMRRAEANLKAEPVVSGKFGVDWSRQDVLKINKADGGDAKEEQLDSIVRKGMDGSRVSKQVFMYTKNGYPLHCDNYLPDDATGEWERVGYFDYEYDNLGRVVSQCAVDDTGSGDNVKYEFFYSDDTPYYSSQIYSTRENGEWMPAQKADYAYDANFNTIEETYSLYDADNAGWLPVERKTATYDSQSRMTSYYEWLWDEAAGEWISDEGSLFKGQKYEYDAEGRDKMTVYIMWKDGAWLDYEQYIYNYDEAGNVSLIEVNYWNEAKKDWSGGFTRRYPNGYEAVYYNQRQEYTYDGQNRETQQLVLDQNAAGEWKQVSRSVTEYEDRADGGYDSEKTEYIQLTQGSDELSLYKMTEQNFNKYGAEIYYKAYRYNGTETLRPTEETIRNIDEYNNYHGVYYYEFAQDKDGTFKRIGVQNTQYIYADDWDPAAGYETPMQILRQKGAGTLSDIDMVDYSLDEYKWENNDVRVYFMSSYYIDGVLVPAMKRVDYYDYQTPAASLVLWPTLKLLAPYKQLSVETYGNLNYASGSMEWSPSETYTDTYYYGAVIPSGIVSPETTAEGAKEVARYNLGGQRVDRSAKGIVIIKYDDGTTRKVLNR